MTRPGLGYAPGVPSALTMLRSFERVLTRDSPAKPLERRRAAENIGQLRYLGIDPPTTWGEEKTCAYWHRSKQFDLCPGCGVSLEDLVAEEQAQKKRASKKRATRD